MLKPTFKLAAQLANAYDEIRQQSNHLLTFTEVCGTGPLTGVSIRQAARRGRLAEESRAMG